MERVVEQVKITNVFEPTKSVEIEALIDTGAVMLVLPQNVVDELGLRKMREVRVRYANNTSEVKSLYDELKRSYFLREGQRVKTLVV